MWCSCNTRERWGCAGWLSAADARHVSTQDMPKNPTVLQLCGTDERMDKVMTYTVYEEFPDGKRFFRFENEDRFECEVYVFQHKYDRGVSGKLIIEEK